MSDVSRRRLVIVHATVVKKVRDLGQIFDVVGRVHPKRFDRYVLFLVCPTPYVRITPGSEGNLAEPLDLIGIQVVRIWQDPCFRTRLSQRSLELALGFWQLVFVS